MSFHMHLPCLLRKSVLLILPLTLVLLPAFLLEQKTASTAAPRQMENLNRGLVAVKVNDGVFVSWRLLGTESSSVGFNLYRNGTKVNSSPITDSTNYLDTAGTSASTYFVRAVRNGVEQQPSGSVGVWTHNYLDVPIQKPDGGVTPDGVSYTYFAGDASVGDLDGDGDYEIVLKWDPTNAKDNAQSGYTGNVYLDAYEMDGTRKWRIDLGKNIRAGAHYTPFLVYDFDGDGKAEVVCKTADGTIDGTGNVIGSAAADYRDSNGRILSGPEYLTVFAGDTGEILATTNYEPARGNVSDWGDSYGNRVDRFLAAVAYLDGVRPSIVMARGYYAKTALVAYDWRNGQLTKRWTFDSTAPGNSIYAGQGNHNLGVADVDGDGRDEIVYGSMTLDDNGTGLYSTGLGHGDAIHVGDFNPDRAGLEVFKTTESGKMPYGAEVHDAQTGEILWGVYTGRDTGGGSVGDVDPRYKGVEVWAGKGVGLYSITGTKISSNIPKVSFGIWWDGDLLREFIGNISYSTTTKTGLGGIFKWDYASSTFANILSADGTLTRDDKGNPVLQADLLGDWREELIYGLEDSSALRIYTTTDVSSHRFHTLMHDPVYRLGVAWQNVGYNMPPQTSFYLGDGMVTPAKPNIYTTAQASIDGQYQIINPESGKVLSINANDRADGSNVHVIPNNNRVEQLWSITSNGDGTYKILNPNSGKVLGVQSNGTADGANVQILTDTGGKNQKWWIVKNGDGTYKITNTLNGKALDVAGGGTASGTNVLLRTDNGGLGQKWQLIIL